MRQRLGDEVLERVALVEHQAPLRRDHRSAAGRRVHQDVLQLDHAQTFGTVGVAPAIEFVAIDLDPLGSVTTHVETKDYVNRGTVDLLVEDLLADLRFRSPVARLRAQRQAWCPTS